MTRASGQTKQFAIFAVWSVLFATSAAPGAAVAADPAYGEYLSSECVTCHRRDGQGQGIPTIIGLPTEQFIAALKAYKVKDRPNPIMQTIAGRLSDDDIAALAAYYSSQKAP